MAALLGSSVHRQQIPTEMQDRDNGLRNFKQDLHGNTSSIHETGHASFNMTSLQETIKSNINTNQSFNAKSSGQEKKRINEDNKELVPVSEIMMSRITKDCDGRFHWILDTWTPEPDPDRAKHSVPRCLQIRKSGIPEAGLGVWAVEKLPACTLFGPYQGVKFYKDVMFKDFPYGWVVFSEYGTPMFVVDAKDESQSNWIRYVNSAMSEDTQNVWAVEYMGMVFYYSKRAIEPGTELLVWYGDEYGRALGLIE